MWIIVTAFFCKHTRQDCRFRWKPVVPELGDSIHEADVVFARRCKGPNSVGQILSCARVCRFAPGSVLYIHLVETYEIPKALVKFILRLEATT